jgi:dTDP-4-amino-4,6-dideoxygalactose transaminase
MFAELSGCRFAIALTSGTVALELALMLLDLEPGDEVLTTPFTFAATINAIIHSGATARFIDVDEDGLMDVSSISAHLTERTRVLLPVHLYGAPVDLRAIPRLPGVQIVEDAAQAIGAKLGDVPVGSFGLGCFSLYATKNVTTGEGGILTLNDPALAELGRVIRNQGMRSRYDYQQVGHNYRMTDIHAAIGIPQLRRIDEINARRAANAEKLITGLAGVAGLRLPSTPLDRTHVWHQFTIRVTDEATISRDGLATALAAKGIGTGIYYPRVVLDYDCYNQHPQVRSSAVPIARKLASQVLSLPVHPGLSHADIEQIVIEVRNSLRA